MIKLYVIFVLGLLVLATGCMNVNGLIRAAGKDPASVHITVKTIYGTVEYDRTNPLTNSISHSVKDGVITVVKGNQ